MHKINTMKHKNDPHIIYIITKLELGGAQKVCLALFNNAQKNGITASLIAGDSGILVNQVKHLPNVYLLSSFTREVSNFWHEFHCFIQLTKLLRQLKKQYPNSIVHTHSTKAGIFGRWAAVCAGIKIRIHTIHGYAFHEHQQKIVWWAIYLLELLTSLITTHFVCVSSTDVAIGTKLFPRFSHKYSIIRAAIDWEQFYIPAQHTSLISWETKPFVFGTVACFKPQKNLFDVLNAFAHVHHHNTDTRLEIIGDGILRPSIEQWIAQHNLAYAITLHGWQERVAPIMYNWHAFVLSSLWEGLPCAVVEARMLKIPVLSYNTGGIHDVITHNHNGFLYQQKDWQALAHGMLALTHNKNLYLQLHNYPDNLSAFNPCYMINRHIDLYKQLHDRV